MTKPKEATAGPEQRRPVLVLSAVTGLAAAALAWGWNTRDDLYLSPESGIGYWLGIVGTSMMLLLLLYSLRKRVQLMRTWGSVRHWFVTHMLLGIVGPLAVIFHADFRLGSLNSTIALTCVILVASSGLVGRYIYPKIHHGLFGHRASLSGLKQELERNRGAIDPAVTASPRLGCELGGFEAFALAGGAGTLGSAWRLLTLPLRARSTRRNSLRCLAAAAPLPVSSETAEAVAAYVEGVRKVAEFNAFVRLFSLWHAFHLPFCVMLFVAAAVHVVAVHMY